VTIRDDGGGVGFDDGPDPDPASDPDPDSDSDMTEDSDRGRGRERGRCGKEFPSWPACAIQRLGASTGPRPWP
jgi:hypothetical protein